MAFSVKILCRKVQDFIFQSPKLKHMLGANSLVGELFCHDLPELRKKDTYKKVSLTYESEQSVQTGNYDNPGDNFKQGIVSAAGGHFEALFCDHNDAFTFAMEAASLARTKTPGLQLDFILEEIDLDGTYNPGAIAPNCFTDLEMKQIRDELEPVLIDNPFLRLSADGVNPVYKPETPEASALQNTLLSQANKFYNHETKEFLSSWYKEVVNELKLKLGKESDKEFDSLRKLSQTTKANMLAIIKMDGNAVGSGFIDFRNGLKENGDPIKTRVALAKMESFWHTKRNAVRDMLKKAVIAVTKEMYKNNTKLAQLQMLPFTVLMMGGDDILLISIPEFAHPLLKELSCSLEQQKDVSYSFGITFFKYNYPFVHAHQLADSLLDSAKIKSRQVSENLRPVNALDWHILYSTKPQSIASIRQSEYLIKRLDGSLDVLSRKPYSLAEGLKVFELAHEQADKLANEDKDIGKNKLRMLRTSIYKGRRYTELLIDKQLASENYIIPDWLSFDEQGGTMMLDILELLDIIPPAKDKEASGGEK